MNISGNMAMTHTLPRPGLAANVLEITPPLILSDAECEEGLAIIDRALGDVAAGLVPDDAVQTSMNW